MTLTLATRIQQIKPSATLSLGAKVNQLKAEGKDIINLTVGEPDFDTPEHIKEAARQALREGFTKYTAVDGIPGLKQAIIQKLANENQLNYQPSQIIVSNGTKQGIYNLGQILLNPGDEVIIPAPYWVSYPDMMLLAGAKPVFISTTKDQHFKISADQLAKAITPKTRLLILNSPSNPTGMAYSKRELEDLAKVLLQHPQIVIASDDMYEHILWTREPFANIVNACPDLKDRTVVFNGVSKAYCMTGWRIGYAAGPKELISAMNNLQSQSTSNPNSIAQVAAQIALSGDQTSVRELCQTYKERSALITEELNCLPFVRCLPADGTFYLFPCVTEFLQKCQMQSDIEFAGFLLDSAEIAVVPGTPFGAPGYIRISLVSNIEVLREAIKRLKAVLQ